LKEKIKAQLELKDYNSALDGLVIEKTKKINETRKEIIKRLSIPEEFNCGYNPHHLERVGKYAYSIARAYGLDENDAELLRVVAAMHDIEKIGTNIISDNNSELLMATKIIAQQHHERWDGNGYPDGLSGSSINIFARITIVADIFDALTSERPYKEAWTVEHAVKFIKNKSGMNFDPEVVEALIKVIPEIVIIKEKYSDLKKI
jgi:putative two-component system response regulator